MGVPLGEVHADKKDPHGHAALRQSETVEPNELHVGYDDKNLRSFGKGPRVRVGARERG